MTDHAIARLQGRIEALRDDPDDHKDFENYDDGWKDACNAVLEVLSREPDQPKPVGLTDKGLRALEAALAYPAQAQSVEVAAIVQRLRELAHVVTRGPEAVSREFTMRVPAEPLRDADLVLDTAAKLLAAASWFGQPPTEEQIRAAWWRWWFDEGSGIAPLPGHDHEQHARRVTEIAWSNGAYCVRYPRSSHWQPMDYAPKDGTPILGRRRNSEGELELAVVQWEAFPPEFPSYWVLLVTDGIDDNRWRPTEWQPLPPDALARPDGIPADEDPADG